MSRMTLRLPESLHDQLTALARNEAVSLNQYIVYALTRQVTLAYTVQPIADEKIKEQKAAYSALLQGLGQSTFADVEEVLTTRAKVKPEKGLTPNAVRALRSRMARHKLGN